MVYEGCNVYITPTIEEIGKLVECGVDIIALDAITRPMDITKHFVKGSA